MAKRQFVSITERRSSKCFIYDAVNNKKVLDLSGVSDRGDYGTSTYPVTDDLFLFVDYDSQTELFDVDGNLIYRWSRPDVDDFTFSDSFFLKSLTFNKNESPFKTVWSIAQNSNEDWSVYRVVLDQPGVTKLADFPSGYKSFDYNSICEYCLVGGVPSLLIPAYDSLSPLRKVLVFNLQDNTFSDLTMPGDFATNNTNTFILAATENYIFIMSDASPWQYWIAPKSDLSWSTANSVSAVFSGTPGFYHPRSMKASFNADVVQFRNSENCALINLATNSATYMSAPASQFTFEGKYFFEAIDSVVEGVNSFLVVFTEYKDGNYNEDNAYSKRTILRISQAGTPLEIVKYTPTVNDRVEGFEPIWLNEYVIRGSVVNSSDQPVAGVKVSLMNNSGVMVTTTETDALGEYALTCFSDNPRIVCLFNPATGESQTKTLTPELL